MSSCRDLAYPAQLKQIYDPPLILYVRGTVETISQPGIALVGTRHPTPYGSGMAERLACDLAARGLVIFSGMARGVDTAGHRGAIAGKGKTVAVFGTGVDVIYPKENSRLLEQILALGGAAISEFPLETFPAPQEFSHPQSNHQRYFAGGAGGRGCGIQWHAHHGTLCVGAKPRGFCRPWQRDQQRFVDAYALIKQGAKLVATWEDVWEELPGEVRLTLLPEGSGESQAGQTASLFGETELSPHEKKIFAMLKSDEATQIDEIVERLEPGLSSSEIFAALFELELAGKVKQLPGKNFVKSF